MTVNQVFYNYLKNNSSMQTEFNNVYYVVNDRNVKEPYAVIYQIDDPQETSNLCVDPSSQGQARFVCESYNKQYTEGIDKRKIFQDVCRGIESTTTDNINIYRVKTESVIDRPERINGLFLFSFEAVLSWELDT